MKNNLIDAISWVREEVDALGSAPMYWVARHMVEPSMAASKTLPSWSPSAAEPAPSGLLCWAKPAGLVPYGDPATTANYVAWDAVWWRTRPDGIMQLQLASRFAQNPDLRARHQARTPLWATSAVYLDPNHSRVDDTNGSEDMHPVISIVGAAWLLMSQPSITETRVTESVPASPPPRGGPQASHDGQTREPLSVTIIEIHRDRVESNSSRGGRPDRQYRGRWMVGWPNGYWRQQSYGPGGNLRKPILIAPHTAGPKGAGLIPPKERVYVWRR